MFDSNVIDVTESVLAAWAGEPSQTEEPSVLFAPVEYAIPMFARTVSAAGFHVVANLPRFASPDHFANYYVLLDFCVRVTPPATFSPLIDSVLALDDHSLLAYGFLKNKVYERHQYDSLRLGFWRLFHDRSKDHFLISLTEKARFTALMMLDQRSKSIRASVCLKAKDTVAPDPAAQDYTVRVSLAFGLGALNDLRIIMPDDWRRFEEESGLRADDIETFDAFISYLDISCGLWLPEGDGLRSLFDDFVRSYGRPDIDKQMFDKLLDLFSLPLEQAAKWGIPAAFIGLGESYLRFDDYKRLMDPGLSALSLLVRKYEGAWSRTVGSQLAKAADYIGSKLDKHSRMSVVTRRNTRHGELDLAVYDKLSNDVVICEVKTVYDRFRTSFRYESYAHERVDVAKAVKQLRRIETAFAGDSLTLAEVFIGTSLPIKPRSITKCLLTWWDGLDLTINSPDDDIICLTFDAFITIMNACDGDVGSFATCVEELRSVSCVGTLRKLDITPPEAPTFQVAQRDCFMPIECYVELGLSEVSLRLLELLPCLPFEHQADADDSLIDYLSEVRPAR